MEPSNRVERLGSGVKRLLRTLLTLVVVLAIITLGESLPPMRALDTLLREHDSLRQVLIGTTIVMSAVGALLLALSQFLPKPKAKRGKDGEQVEIASPLSKYSNASGGGRVVWDRSFTREVSFASTKAAWRLGSWRYERRWRIFFSMLLGAILTTCGTFGLIIVVGSPGVKCLVGGALVYAVARTTWAVWRA